MFSVLLDIYWFNILRSFQAFFQSSYIIFHSYQQCMNAFTFCPFLFLPAKNNPDAWKQSNQLKTRRYKHENAKNGRAERKYGFVPTSRLSLFERGKNSTWLSYSKWGLLLLIVTKETNLWCLPTISLYSEEEISPWSLYTNL